MNGGSCKIKVASLWLWLQANNHLIHWPTPVLEGWVQINQLGRELTKLHTTNTLTAALNQDQNTQLEIKWRQTKHRGKETLL